jgi:hypothetical protein
VNPLMSVIERERRLAGEHAVAESAAQLERDLRVLHEQGQERRSAAALREKTIRETVERTGRNVRDALASEVYAALEPLVRRFRDEHNRAAVRDLAKTWKSFEARCLAETGRKLESRPVINIMIVEIAGDGAPLVFAQALNSQHAYNPLMNLGGALTAALHDGHHLGAVERALDDIEANITRHAQDLSLLTPSERGAARWEAQRTALSDVDASQLVAAAEPPRVMPTLTPRVKIDVAANDRDEEEEDDSDEEDDLDTLDEDDAEDDEDEDEPMRPTSTTTSATNPLFQQRVAALRGRGGNDAA